MRVICGIAQIYAAMGDPDETFAHLEKAFEERYYEVVHDRVDPGNDPLRSERRFHALLHKMRFPG